MQNHVVTQIRDKHYKEKYTGCSSKRENILRGVLGSLFRLRAEERGLIVYVPRQVAPPLAPRTHELASVPRWLSRVLWGNPLFWVDFLPDLT